MVITVQDNDNAISIFDDLCLMHYIFIEDTLFPTSIPKMTSYHSILMSVRAIHLVYDIY